MKFVGKVALVTGAASGIGLATSRLLAREGATVIMSDVRPTQSEPDIREQVGQSEFVRCDVANSDDVDALAAHAFKRYGKIDILVNNAGVPLSGSVVDTDVADWDRLMAVNVKGVFLCGRAVIPLMRQGSGGAIVNVGSELGLVGIASSAAYCASKGAVIQLTRAMAIDHAAEGIRVNCVCPGPIQTPLLQHFLDAEGDSQTAASETASSALLDRIGTAEEVANVIAFAASDEASYMTGSVLVVDGGVTAR